MRSIGAFALLSFLLLASAVPLRGYAVGPASQPSDETDEAPAARPPDPSGKLYENYEMQRGFYIASDIGLFLALGGAVQVVSNAQPYVGLNIGYDFNRWFSWQIHGGAGFAAGAARTANEAGRLDNFTTIFMMTGPLVWILLWERLALELKVQGGVAILNPVPFDATIDGVIVSPYQPAAGGGAALKYLTLLTDFTLGLDLTFNFLIGAHIPTLTVSPTVRYTF